MADTFIGVALGVLFVATLSFLYGFISTWIQDKNKCHPQNYCTQMPQGMPQTARSHMLKP
jgi:hypothetical protein